MRKIIPIALSTMLFARCFSAEAQQAEVADFGSGKLNRVR